MVSLLLESGAKFAALSSPSSSSSSTATAENEGNNKKETALELVKRAQEGQVRDCMCSCGLAD